MSICETVGVTKRFGGLTAVDSVDFQVEEGDVIGMIGPNGAGKTTFVNMLAGVLKPDAGQIFYNDEDITSEPAHSRANRGIARSFQIPRIYEEMTPLENIMATIVTRENVNLRIVKSLRNWSDYESEARELLERFNLGDQADVMAEHIPHGDKKILDIASSVALNPEFLILDEPTSGVASSEKENVMDLILDNVASPERGVLFVSHDMEFVRKYSTQAVALDRGQILSQGDTEKVMENPKVKARIRGET